MAKLLTVAEAAAELKVSKGKIYRMTWSGELYTQRIGRSVRIPASSIEAFTQPPSGYVHVNQVGGNR
jgi:excisionase family DNA binding protein